MTGPVAVTGGFGFLGWHVRVQLHARGIESVPVGRETFNDDRALDAVLSRCSALVHTAAVNRAEDPTSLQEQNRAITATICSALDRNARSIPTVVTNSIHESLRESAYGQAKRQSAEAVEKSCERLGSPFLNLVLPHLFGEYGRHEYNSAIATFANCLANGEEPDVNRAGQLELLHVQDAARQIADFVEQPASGKSRIEGTQISVGEVWDRLSSMHHRYVSELTVPQFHDCIDLQLFNTLRSHLFVAGHYPVRLAAHADERGVFAELCRSDSIGQTSVSTSKPGVERGDHFHFDKIERFIVVSGEAEISLRRMFDDSVVRFRVNGSDPTFIDMPTLTTHKIVNTGTETLTTMFWAGDHFDPTNPDTFAEPVELAQ